MSPNAIYSVAILLLTSFFSSSLFSTEVWVREIRDLRIEAKLSAERSAPILLMIAADHCPYCTLVEEDIIKPMLISGDYVNKAVIRKLDLDTQSSVIDFDGNRVDSRAFAGRYDVDVTPTMLFLDGNGRQVVKRMVGVTTIDYYGYYLDEAIDRALGKMRKTE